ncbi:penicillin-binding protein 2 [Pseudoalteromonas ulvae UL12]|nr:penicillin-binding protein 2 [Pseudoalteromonas ulvae UL12]
MMFKRRSQIRDHSAEANLFARRSFIAFVFVLILIAILFVNIYQLQVIAHQSYQTRSNDNRIKLVPIAPNRGLIYDRNGVILAENQPIFNLEAIPEDVDDMADSIIRLSAILDISDAEKSEFLDDIKQQRRFKSQVLKSRLNEEQVAKFSAHQHKFPGFSIEARLARHYPFGDTLTHALGYVAKLNKKELNQLQIDGLETNYRATRYFGKLGLEKYYEHILHGTVGSQEVEINNRGRILRTLSSTPPVPGEDLVLTLDVGLQQIAQYALKDSRGAVVVLDAKSGGILALYSNPSYDPNLFVHGISRTDYRALLNPDRPLINRATQGSYAPASTIKPLMAIFGLEEGLITESTTMFDPGFFQIPNVEHRWRDWKRWGHGKAVDVYQAIEESCDTFFYDIAFRAGVDKISNFMAQFGFGELSGVDIYEETSAILPSKEWKKERFKESWWRGDTISVGIGQGYWTATPMQIANATNIMVNKGVHNPPHLVSLTKLGEEVNLINNEEKPPITLKDPHNWQIAIDAMHNTVYKKTGTAHAAFVGADYDPSGKTGTAQVVSIAQGERYDAENLKEKHRDNALYIGFAPYSDPEIIVMVTVENTGGGSSVGAPIARQLMDYHFSSQQSRADTP